ncbi:SWF or SNF family helicase [Streptomyces sp. NPDC048172]|uniref:SWIM zinc finger family protein n=1 Tax=Streptomyces sp. NPDC048172 TaxID=3365505 RepID=UPI00370FC475
MSEHDDMPRDKASELERIFEALPPARGRGFARTWWGQTWLKALEDTALDNQQLRQGRKYAREGAVGAVSVRPGRITAMVLGADRVPFRADVLLRELGEDEWDRLLEVIANEAGHIAALLDRDMPPTLAEDASDAGIELLPGIGDLEPACTCDAWDHCHHTAALSYQVARLLDEDPFVLLLMRGRGEREVLDDLQARSAARAAEAAGEQQRAAQDGGDEPEGVPAQEAYALGAVLPPLPGPLPPVTDDARVAVFDGGTEAPGVDVGALELLAADTAERARRTLAEALSPAHARRPVPAPLTRWQDAVRLASSRPGRSVTARLAEGCGRPERDLGPAVRAWEFGGAVALEVLEEDSSSGSPEETVLARARTQVDAAWADDDARPRLRASGNRWTVVGADAQLRCGRDGRWWPYRKERGRWWPAGSAEHDPASALAVALEGAEASG